MQCTTARTMMISSLDDRTASELERRALAAHLDACAACRAEHERTHRLARALAELAPEVPVPPALEGEVLRRVRGLDGDVVTWAERLRAWLPAPVLAAGAVATILFVVVGDRDPMGEAPEPLARPRAIETPPTRVATATMRPDRAAPADTNGPVRTAQHDGDEQPPTDPPAELAATLPLLLDLPILRNMEKLENYESIEDLTRVDEPTTDEPGTSG